jgi:hypothetical protein
MEGASLEEVKRNFGGALQSIDAREIPSADLQKVTRYAAKLLERAPRSVPQEELWSIMPRSLAEREATPGRSGSRALKPNSRRAVRHRWRDGAAGEAGSKASAHGRIPFGGWILE